MEEINGDISILPESCISHALSFTSPLDACRSAVLSTTFRRAADSDTVWDRFLPSDLPRILSNSVESLSFDSKKGLYFRLCEPILIDGDKMSFELERSSGKKCFMISARELVIIWGDTPEYWRWIPSSDSRFAEVAELVNVCWLEIHGKIDAKILSPKTSYRAYLVFKITEEAYGLDVRAEASVRFGTYASERQVQLVHNDMPHGVVGSPSDIQILNQWRGPRNRWRGPRNSVEHTSHARDDEWVKLELGEFYIDEGDEGEIDISLMEVKGGHWKSGLIVQGIEVRPQQVN